MTTDTMIADELLKLGLSRFAKQVLTEARSVRFFNTAEELAEAAVPEDQDAKKGTFYFFCGGGPGNSST